MEQEFYQMRSEFQRMQEAHIDLVVRVQELEKHTKFPPIKIRRNWLGVPVLFETDSNSGYSIDHHPSKWIRFNGEWFTLWNNMIHKIKHSPYQWHDPAGVCSRCENPYVRYADIKDQICIDCCAARTREIIRGY